MKADLKQEIERVRGEVLRGIRVRTYPKAVRKLFNSSDYDRMALGDRVLKIIVSSPVITNNCEVWLEKRKQ